MLISAIYLIKIQTNNCWKYANFIGSYVRVNLEGNSSFAHILNKHQRVLKERMFA